MGKNNIIRDSYIDVVKGIGIFSIVMGHASWEIPVAGHSLQVGAFVYLYHLAIFFFCSGYLYKDTVSDFWGFVAKKLKGLYKPFLIYTFIYFLCRNIFISMGILQAEKYTLGTLAINLTNTITFNSVAEFLSAFWFLPVLFFSLCFYTAVNYLTAKISLNYLKEGIRICCYLGIGFVGLYATEQGFGLLYNIQIAYLMVPVIALGHYYALYKDKLDKCINIVGLVVSFSGLVYILALDIGIIELSKFMIINRYAFYPVTICGIWFCLCLGKLLCKSGLLTRIFALAGQMSFDIMAMHFLAFKLVDYTLCMILGETENLGLFPHTFTAWWPLYYVVGMGVPILVKKAVEKLLVSLGSQERKG